MEEVTLIARYIGDPSVGIPEEVWEIHHISAVLLEDWRERESVREAFEDAFSLMIGEEVIVEFSDELPKDCLETPEAEFWQFEKAKQPDIPPVTFENHGGKIPTQF